MKQGLEGHRWAMNGDGNGDGGDDDSPIMMILHQKPENQETERK